MSTDTPRNRKERRAAARSAGEKFRPLESAASIPLAHPDYSAPKTKTLFDIADERNQLLQKGQPFAPHHGDGLVRDEMGRVLLPAKEVSRNVPPEETPVAGADSEEGDDEPIGPLGESIFYCISLSMLYFTLSLLVHNQYGTQPPTLWPLVMEAARTAPVLFGIVYAMKVPVVARREMLKQGAHFVVGVAAGCHLIWMGNRANYLAVMKRAPPVGTIWVWCVIEMKLGWAVASLGICVGYLLWNGFSVI
ncbi:hypothetical protein C1H76_6841 [Elsinoe australis]|uniref:DUF7719 domain-containing protein n=1 Tax=Elsinoe australis TaxID=40998 RepID=A0A4U7AWH3_9PEZI|nr:hypothetical protein C1H76_6841 [Elsinoe australis]